jgi:phospholipid/cholesterol/gamma-HCH transport system substrate-binding protein
MKSIGTETKVGIFVLLGIIALAFLTIRVGRISVREQGYKVYTHLDSAAGLDKNSLVRIAGVEVGRVTEITLEEGKAKVAIFIPKNVHIPVGSKIYVKSSGLLGEKYIEIIPPRSPAPEIVPGGAVPQGPQSGRPDRVAAQLSSLGDIRYVAGYFAYARETAPEKAPAKPQPRQQYVQPGQEIPEGGPAVDVDRVLGQLSSIGNDIKAVTQSLSNAMGGPEGEKQIKEIIARANTTAANLQDITARIDRGEGTLGKLVRDEKLYKEVKDTVANLQDITRGIDRGEGTLGKLAKDDTLYKEMKDTMANLSLVSRQIESGEGTLGKLVKDDSLYVETRATMVEAKETLANLGKVSKQIESGEGTLGKLMKDDSLYVETQATMTQAKETLANLNKVSKQIESGEGTIGKLVKDETLYDDARRAVKSVQRAADGIAEVTPVTVLGLILSNVIR